MLVLHIGTFSTEQLKSFKRYVKTNAMNRDTARDLVMSFVSQTSRVNRCCRVARCCRVQVTTELDISETNVIKKLKDLNETPQL